MTRNGSDGGEGGFTLLEVILVVSIIGILATMGFPAFSSFIRDFRMDSFSNKVLSAMRNARFTAMSENRPVRVVVEMGESTQYGDDRISFEICSRQAGEDGDCPDDATFVRAPGMAPLNPPEPVVISSTCNNNTDPYGTSTGTHRFKFNPNGKSIGYTREKSMDENCGTFVNPYLQLTVSPVPEEDDHCEFHTIVTSTSNGLPRLFPFRINPFESVNESPHSDLECARQ